MDGGSFILADFKAAEGDDGAKNPDNIEASDHFGLFPA